MSRTTFRLLQDVLQARRKNTFVGRAQALYLFNQNLDYAPEDERKRFVIHVHGPSGIGTTRLLRRFEEIARNRGYLTAWVAGRGVFHLVDLLETCAEQLGARQGRFPTFIPLLELYRRLRRLLQADPQISFGIRPRLEERLLTQWLPRTRRGTLGTLLERLVEYGRPLLAPTPFEDQLAKKVPSSKERQLLLAPVEQLTRAFLNDLLEIAEHTPVLFLFDDYDLMADIVEPWLFHTLEGTYGPVSCNVLWVLGGHGELNRVRWAPYESLLARLVLEPFSEEEVQDFLARRGIQSSQARRVVMHLTQGKPVWVSALAHALPQDESRLGAFSGAPLDRLMQWLAPQQREYLLLAALPRFVTLKLLAVLSDAATAEKAWAWLQKQPFLEVSQGRGYLNRDVRQALLRYWRSHDVARFVSYNERLIAYFAQEREKYGQEDNPKDSLWQELMLQEMYHRLTLVRDEALAQALDGFFMALDVDWDWAYQWARMLVDLGWETESWSLYRWGQDLLKLYLALSEQEDQQAITVLTHVVNAPDPIARTTRAMALAYRGFLYFLQEDVEQALHDLSKAVQLAPQLTWIRERRAVVSLMAREPAQAIKDFLWLTEEEPRPWVLFARGCAYVLLDRYNEALADFNQVVQDPEIGPWARAMRGEVYRLQSQEMQALQDYKEAWKQLGFRPWLANRLGMILLRLGRFAEAVRVFDQILARYPDDAWAWANRGLAYEMQGYFSRALSDFTEALHRKPDFVWAMARRGELLMLLGKQEQALRDFNQVLRLKPPYSFVRALRALLLARKGQMEAALQDIRRALQHEPNNDWYLYCQGLVFYRAGRIEEARTALQHAVELARRYASKQVLALLNLMLYYLALGEEDQAEAVWKQVLAKKPSPFFLRMAQYHLEILKDFRPETGEMLHRFIHRIGRSLTQRQPPQKATERQT